MEMLLEKGLETLVGELKTERRQCFPGWNDYLKVVSGRRAHGCAWRVQGCWLVWRRYRVLDEKSLFQ